jgi:hypothetical protein
MGDIGPYRAHYDVLPADDLEFRSALPLANDPSVGVPDGTFARGSDRDEDSREQVDR